MMLCLTCLTQKPNKYTQPTCPRCKSILKYVDSPAKNTIIKMHKAGLAVSYAVAEVYIYGHGAVHTVNVVIGLANPYRAEVFRELPAGIGYILPNTPNDLSHTPPAYGLLRYEIPYLDHKEARAMLKQKLRELDAWIDEAQNSGWISICNLGGLL